MRWLVPVAFAACAARPAPPVIANTLIAESPHESTSAIQGVVADTKTNEPLAGVTIVATSPRVRGAQTAITDEHGAYRVVVAPGEYVVTFYFAEVTLERPGVRVASDSTTRLFQKLHLP